MAELEAHLSYTLIMAANAVVRSRISLEVKEQAAAVLEPLGLTVSGLMRIVLTRIASEGALPFEMKLNKLTRDTLRKSARGEQVHTAKDAKDLFDQLGI